EVGPAVVVQVRHRGEEGHRAGGEGLLGGEGGGGGPGRRRVQEHRRRVVGEVGDGEVGPAVAVEVAHRHAVGTVRVGADGEGLLGGEGSAARPGRGGVQQHRHRVVVIVGGGEVGPAVAVEVPRRQADVA